MSVQVRSSQGRSGQARSGQAQAPPRRLRRVYAVLGNGSLPRKRTLASLGALGAVLALGRPVVLVGYGAYALGRALAGGRCGKREA